MRYLFLLLLFVSCSTTKRANYHLKRALKLNPGLVTTKRDTIIKTISDSGRVYFDRDTVIDNQFVFISVVHRGDYMDLFWKLKRIQFEIPVDNTTIVPPKTRYEVRQENKTERYKIKYLYKTVRDTVRINNKFDYKQHKNDNKQYSFIMYLLGILTVILVRYIFVKFVK